MLKKSISLSYSDKVILDFFQEYDHVAGARDIAMHTGYSTGTVYKSIHVLRNNGLEIKATYGDVKLPSAHSEEGYGTGDLHAFSGLIKQCEHCRSRLVGVLNECRARGERFNWYAFLLTTAVSCIDQILLQAGKDKRLENEKIIRNGITSRTPIRTVAKLIKVDLAKFGLGSTSKH